MHHISCNVYHTSTFPKFDKELKYNPSCTCFISESKYIFRTCITFTIGHIITDIDNNGWLDKHDFECMALRMTLIEGKGEFNCNRYQENLHIMLSLWEEITDLADFDKVRSTFLRELSIAIHCRDVSRKLRPASPISVL